MSVRILADVNIPYVTRCFSHLGTVRTIPGRQITAREVQGADILLVRSVTPVNRQLLEGSAVRFVGTATIGFEHVDVEYLKEKGIAFASAPGSNANSVAEYVVAALLEIAQKKGLSLEGKSIGIIGAGHVGSLVERKCRALGMRVVLNDPPLFRKTADPIYRPIEETLDCHIVTLHVPLTFDGPDRTFHLADDRFFDVLRTGAIFVNTSRGAVHHTSALKKAIRSGRLSAVVLDVWEAEPNVDLELLDMVDIATPHIAGYSLDGKVAGMIMIYQKVCEFLGQRPIFEASDLLPAPDVPLVRLQEGQDPLCAILQAVRCVWPILEDDRQMRATLADRQRVAAIFDALRRDYRQRREFHNTTVLIGPGSCRLADMLSGIGFKIGRMSDDQEDR